MNGQTSRWLDFAREDLRMAELAYNEGLWNQVCFHSQQCAEKALKGLIIRRGHLPPRTHKIADLLAILGGEGLPVRDLYLLDRFYMPTRYPDALPGFLPEGLPSKKDAIEALELARELMNVIENRNDCIG